MKPTFKKLEVPDLSNLEKLVAENIEGIEPGLRVIDARLCLGQAAIDLVALDARKALVLVALDFAADEGLLLRVMDAYSWCREYPDTLRRLYPMANVSATRPPRILFIVERVTDAFVRRIKQLSFLEIDCLEFRHLEVNGASAVYFDLVERLRRAAPVEPLSDDERVIITTPVRTPKRIEAESPVVQPAWRPVAEPPAVQPSAWAPATADHAPFVAPEPAPSVEEVASAVPGLGVSLESRMAELFAELSTEDTPSAIETPTRIEAEPPVVQPAWPSFPEPQAVQASAVASASSDSAPFQAPEPAPSVEEVASAVPEVGVSLESRMAELFAELSAAEIPSSAEMPTEEYAAPEEEHAVPSLEVVDAEAVTDEPPLRLESIDATARQEEPESPSRSADVAANSDLQTLLRELHVETQPEIEPPTDEAEVESTERAAEAPAEAPVETNAAAVEEQAGAELIGCSGGHVDPTGRSCWHDPSAVCFCQCHASQAAAPAEVETPAPATTRPFWAKPSANKVLPPSGGRTYFFSQVARDSAPARQTVAPWQQVPAPAQPRPAASSRLPATPAAHTAAPAPQPAAAAAGPKPVVAKRKEPIPDHPELESLHFPKDGLSRQWLEFLNQLNGAK